MLKSIENADLSQISLTGLRALAILGLLMGRDRSLEEIREIFIKNSILEKGSSNDILRIDMNTLKAMGCDISRASQKTDYKYRLGNHPFALDFKEEQIAALKKVYKKVCEKASLNKLIEYHKFFKRISNHIYNENSKQALLGISILKSHNIELLEELTRDCEEKRIVTLYYERPTSRTEIKKEVLAQKLEYKNDKFYLYGYDANINEPTVLNIKRVKKIVSRRKNNGNIQEKTFKVKFLLKNVSASFLEENEIITELIGDKCVIEGTYHNEFLAIQRMLFFGPDCTVLEPKEFREEVVTKLKEMRRMYEK
ncbi:MAG: WYL domain-containing protein [bacterium]|nr:WYL domain-containing protein [bacterium]